MIIKTYTKLLHAFLIAWALVHACFNNHSYAQLLPKFVLSQQGANQPFLTPVAASIPSETSAIQSFQGTAVVKSLPQNSQEYNYTAGEWKHSYNTEYTYDKTGLLTSKLNRSVIWSNADRDVYTYDQFGNETERLYQSLFHNDTWTTQFGSRTEYTYNSKNQVVKEVKTDLTNGSWERWGIWQYVYDEQGRKVKYIFDRVDESDFDKYIRIAQYHGSEHSPHTLLDSAIYKDGRFNILHYTDFEWHAEWLPTYYILETWEAGSRMEDKRYTTAYDQYDDEIEFKEEVLTDKGWITITHEQNLLTYNSSGDVTEKIVKKWSSLEQVLKNEKKYVFSNFLRITTGTQQDAYTETKVYPNPATSTLFIEGEITETTQLLLKDLTGKVVLSQLIPAGAATVQELNLTALPKGLYVLTIKNSRATYSSKVVKQ